MPDYSVENELVGSPIYQFYISHQISHISKKNGDLGVDSRKNLNEYRRGDAFTGG